MPARIRTRLQKVACIACLPVIGACGMHAVTPVHAAAAIQLHDCESLGGNFAVPFGLAQAALPDDFEPLPTRGGRRAGAVFYVIAVRCKQAVVDGRRLGPSRIAYAELPVSPAPAWAMPEHADATVPVDFAAWPAVLARAFAARGLGDGTPGRIDWNADDTQGRRVRVTTGDSSFTIRGRPWHAQRTAMAAGRFVVYGVRERTVLHTILGTAGAAHMLRGPLELDVRAGTGLIGHASARARGFSLAGFDLAFAPPTSHHIPE